MAIDVDDRGRGLAADDVIICHTVLGPNFRFFCVYKTAVSYTFWSHT